MQISQRQREMFEQLAELRGVQKKTFDEAALLMRVSSRTLKRWTSTPEYQEVLRDLRETWKIDSQVQTEGLASWVISQLVNLVNETSSGHVKFEALAKLGEWAGLGQKDEHVEVDDREKLERLYKIVEQRKNQLGQAGIHLTLPPGTTIRVPDETIEYVDTTAEEIT